MATCVKDSHGDHCGSNGGKNGRRTSNGSAINVALAMVMAASRRLPLFRSLSILLWRGRASISFRPPISIECISGVPLDCISICMVCPPPPPYSTVPIDYIWLHTCNSLPDLPAVQNVPSARADCGNRAPLAKMPCSKQSEMCAASEMLQESNSKPVN